ncbi:Jag family protein [Naumannella huperziae]
MSQSEQETATQGEGVPAATTEAPEVSATPEESATTEANGAAAQAPDAEAADAAAEEPELSPLDEECEVAADYLEELLDIADLDGDIDSYTEGGRAQVSIITDAEVLIGKDAEVLDALQELARLAVMTETGRRSRLMLDIGGHRDRRRAELRELAADAILEVRNSGDSVALGSMNPFERKIVHDAVAEAGLRSESEGEEPRRHVVVLPSA